MSVKPLQTVSELKSFPRVVDDFRWPSFDSGRFAVTSLSVIRIMCPNVSCKRILAVPAHARGKLVRCRSCGATIRIPDKKEKKEGAPATGNAAEQKPEAG